MEATRIVFTRVDSMSRNADGQNQALGSAESITFLKVQIAQRFK